MFLWHVSVFPVCHVIRGSNSSPVAPTTPNIVSAWEDTQTEFCLNHLHSKQVQEEPLAHIELYSCSRRAFGLHSMLYPILSSTAFQEEPLAYIELYSCSKKSLWPTFYALSYIELYSFSRRAFGLY